MSITGWKTLAETSNLGCSPMIAGWIVHLTQPSIGKPKHPPDEKRKRNSSLGALTLFLYQHFPGSREFAGCERIEIDSACHRFPELIPTVPIRCVGLVVIYSYRQSA